MVKITKPIFLLVIIFIFYAWTTTAGTFAFQYSDYDGNHSRYYNLLTDAFLVHQLHLPVVPDPRLLSLADPYDPAANWPYKLHDCSLYKGKYFLYFGPTPVVFLYLPYRLITGNRLPDTIAVLIFALGTLIWATALLYHLWHNYFRKLPEWMVLLSVVTLGFANMCPFILQRTEIYEVAISSGLFFLTGGIYWLCRGASKDKYNLWMLMLGSAFLGIAIGGRPQIILSGILLPIVLIKIFNSPYIQDLKKRLFITLSLAVPYGVCLILLGAYNYFRFDDPLQFGNKYQTGVANLKTLNYFSFENAISGIYFYLFRSPIINSNFPFFWVEGVLVPSSVPIPTQYFSELITGVFPGVIILLIFIIAPFTFWIKMITSCKSICFKDKVIFNSIIGLVLIPVSLIFLNMIFDSNKSPGLLLFFEKGIENVLSLPMIASILTINIIFWIFKMPVNCKIECQRNEPFPTFEFLLILIPPCLNLVTLIIIPFATMRYLADVVTLLILASLMVWFYFDLQLANTTKTRKLLQIIGVFLTVISIYSGFAYSITGIYGGLKTTNPAEYEKIKSFFEPISELLKYNFKI